MWLALKIFQQYKKFLIPALVIFLLAILLSITNRPPKQGSQKEPAGTPAAESFRLVATEPKLSPDIRYDPSLRIVLIFNKDVSSRGPIYTITPSVDISEEVLLGGLQVILRPKGLWPEGQFLLNVSRETTSLAGEKLDRDYIFPFLVEFDRSGGD